MDGAQETSVYIQFHSVTLDFQAEIAMFCFEYAG